MLQVTINVEFAGGFVPVQFTLFCSYLGRHYPLFAIQQNYTHLIPTGTNSQWRYEGIVSICLSQGIRLCSGLAIQWHQLTVISPKVWQTAEQHRFNPINGGMTKEYRVAIDRGMITECGRVANHVNALKYGWIFAVCQALYNSKWVMF